jgi:hypothetical protein
VHVGKRSNWLGIAISVTALDAGVTTYYGSVVWKAFSVVIWTKLLLVLLAAIWAITLLHVWVYACSHLRQAIQERRVVMSIPVNSLSADMAEETDVRFVD